MALIKIFPSFFFFIVRFSIQAPSGICASLGVALNLIRVRRAVHRSSSMAPPRHFNREDDIFSFFSCNTLTLPPSLFLPFLFLSRLLCPAISPPPPCPPCFKGIVYFELTPPLVSSSPPPRDVLERGVVLSRPFGVCVQPTQITP